MSAGPQPPGAVAGAQPADQAQLPIFRALLVLNLPVALVFGVAPFAAPELFARLAGYVGDEPFIYRLAGAATLGYGAAAGYALRRLQWHRIRIPLMATLVFNAAAVLAAIISLLGGDTRPLVWFIAAAASVFTLITLYWLLRDEGPPVGDDRPVEPWFRAVIAAATLAAAVFGLGPLFAPELLAAATGFATSDLFIYRLAGAGTLGYAVAGVLQMVARRAAEIELQVTAAFVFNALSAVAALVYLVAGGGSPIGWLIAAAAIAFSACFAAWLAGRRTHPVPGGSRS